MSLEALAARGAAESATRVTLGVCRIKNDGFNQNWKPRKILHKILSKILLNNEFIGVPLEVSLASQEASAKATLPSEAAYIPEAGRG